jgi:hypothetical protein
MAQDLYDPIDSYDAIDMADPPPDPLTDPFYRKEMVPDTSSSGEPNIINRPPDLGDNDGDHGNKINATESPDPASSSHDSKRPSSKGENK